MEFIAHLIWSKLNLPAFFPLKHARAFLAIRLCQKAARKGKAPTIKREYNR
jgi:hypothetical protein